MFERAAASLPGGSHLAPRGMGSIATPTTDADVDDLAAAVLGRLSAMLAVAAG